MVEGLREVGSRLHGHYVESGIRALMFLGRKGEYLGAPAPDIILLDVNMPGMSGPDLLVALKASAWAHIPIIMVTSSKRTVDRQRALANGAAAFWTKPSTFHGLCQMAEVIRAWECGEGSLRPLASGDKLFG